MNVRAKPDVIGQVPAYVVWIVINYDLVGIPVPVSAIANVSWGHTPVEIVEPEAIWAAPRSLYTCLGPKPAVKCPCCQGWSK